MVVLDSVYLQMYFHFSLSILFRFEILANYIVATEMSGCNGFFETLVFRIFIILRTSLRVELNLFLRYVMTVLGTSLCVKSYQQIVCYL